MSESYDVVNERITTVDDGPHTVNERLSTGGPGPEGQPDTVCERLSGTVDPALQTQDELLADAPPAAKKPQPRKNGKA